MGNRRHIPRPVKQLVLFMSSRPGMSAKYVRNLTGVSERTQRRIRALHRHIGDVVKVPIRPGRPRILNGLQAGFMEACVEHRPDITLRELKKKLWHAAAVDASEATIYRTLRRRGLTRKKLTVPARERDEEDRAEYRTIIHTHFRPEQLVFVDETACNRHVVRRRYGWAPFGGRARTRDFFVRGRRYSILPALSLDGILALTVQDSSYTSETFNAFIERLLDRMNPWPLRNSVIVLDNASIHKSDELLETVTARGMRLIFLPAYSPDLNPIEEAFSCVKAWLRRHRDYVMGELDGSYDSRPFRMIWNAVYDSVDADKAYGWFKHAGYVV